MNYGIKELPNNSRNPHALEGTLSRISKWLAYLFVVSSSCCCGGDPIFNERVGGCSTCQVKYDASSVLPATLSLYFTSSSAPAGDAADSSSSHSWSLLSCPGRQRTGEEKSPRVATRSESSSKYIRLISPAAFPDRPLSIHPPLSSLYNIQPPPPFYVTWTRLNI